jgi:hypothetical protein
MTMSELKGKHGGLLFRVAILSIVLVFSPGLLPHLPLLLCASFWVLVIRQPLGDLHVLTVTGLAQVT